MEKPKKRRSSLEVAKEAAATAKYRLEALRAKRQLEVEKRAYDAATPSANFPQKGDGRSANAVITHAGDKLRRNARYLDENLDIVVGIFDSIESRTVGGSGIDIDPAVEDLSGELSEATNDLIRRLFEKKCDDGFDTTGQLSWPEIQRLIVRTVMRDGEMLINHLVGPGAFEHSGDSPYTLELLECDHLPFDLTNNNTIVHGVELGPGGKPRFYHLLPEHPGDRFIGIAPNQNTVKVPASQITHLKFARRIGQVRGVTVLHSVLQRLEDIKDYEESERIAARVTASFSAYIKKDTSDPTIPDFDAAGNRLLELSPGMIFDDLLPGEEIGSIGMDRPNSQLEPHRNGQLRAVSAGTGLTYSQVSRNYNGTYSAQRQELVESSPQIKKLQEYFISHCFKPIYRQWLQLEILAGRIPTSGINLETLFSANYQVPALPWIDPLKEIQAHVHAIDAGIKARHQVISELGGKPKAVDKLNEADEFKRTTDVVADDDDDESDETRGLLNVS